jgi:hypothetical protein
LTGQILKWLFCIHTKWLLCNFGIGRLAARAGQSVAEAPEGLSAVPATIIFGEGFFYAAQVNSTAAGGAHRNKMAF